MYDPSILRTGLRPSQLPVGGPSEYRHFELAEAFGRPLGGMYALAFPQYFDPYGNEGLGDWVTIEQESARFRIYQPMWSSTPGFPAPTSWTGRGRGHFAAPHDGGSCGIAHWEAESGRWIVICLEPHALRITGTLMGYYPTFPVWPEYFEIENVQVVAPSDGLIVDPDPAGPFRIHTSLTLWAGEQLQDPQNTWVAGRSAAWWCPHLGDIETSGYWFWP